MKVLFVVGNCLKVNSSANLCHAAYINGFLNSGHTVDLLTASSKNQKIDESINLPKVRNIYEYDISLYDQLGGRKAVANTSVDKINNDADLVNSSPSKKAKMVKKLKKIIRDLYGTYSTDIVWNNNAKKFCSNEEYDLVVSLAFPPISHKLTGYLIKKNHIKVKKWIQIWEDPWFTDLLGDYSNDRIKREEGKLVSLPDKVVYVSPLTLKYQQKMYASSFDKMCWYPLPSYYNVENKKLEFKQLKFGYFGDYNSFVRNLKPFYDTAVENNYYVNICGNSNLKLSSNKDVSIYPRMPLNELKKFEDETNVIIFLCNLKGGQIPGKIYQYSATNKVILFILDGTDEEKQVIRDYFVKYERYVFCDNNEESIKQAVESIPELVKNLKYTTPLTVFNTENIVGGIINEVGM